MANQEGLTNRIGSGVLNVSSNVSKRFRHSLLLSVSHQRGAGINTLVAMASNLRAMASNLQAYYMRSIFFHFLPHFQGHLGCKGLGGHVGLQALPHVAGAADLVVGAATHLTVRRISQAKQVDETCAAQVKKAKHSVELLFETT